MNTASYRYRLLIISLVIVLFSGCASTPPSVNLDTWFYGPDKEKPLLSQYAPVIAIDKGKQSYNRIGQAAARYDENRQEEIFISTHQAVFYTDEQTFHTPSGRYKNLIYRFHFPRVPYSLFPFHLTAGKNGGLFVVVTLNEQREPVLITTVHSCGCYLAMVPTNFLPEAAYPEKWPEDFQTVYGENLPTRINYASPFQNHWRPLIHLRNGTHRVMNISIVDIHQQVLNETVDLVEVEQLYQLPLGDGYTSFFHMTGPNKGYVKDAVKPWERLLMSWWALDWRIGSDKALGPPEESGTIFYTSLKPWQRKASNMADFPAFLTYWGWRL